MYITLVEQNSETTGTDIKIYSGSRFFAPTLVPLRLQELNIVERGVNKSEHASATVRTIYLYTVNSLYIFECCQIWLQIAEHD